MKRFPRVAGMLLVSGALTLAASAQTPPPPPAAGSDAQAPRTAPRALHPGRKSIVQHYPHPYPGYYHGEESAGFRNPGGEGRFLEYYPAGNRFQERGDPVKVAQFDQAGGAPDRAEQIAAQQVGVQKDSMLQQHIDNYARPSFGVGFFGGFY